MIAKFGYAEIESRPIAGIDGKSLHTWHTTMHVTSPTKRTNVQTQQQQQQIIEERIVFTL